MSRYVSIAHFRAPFTAQPIQGLGATHRYWEIANFRAPYDDGYFQSGALQGTEKPTTLADLQTALGVAPTGTWNDATTQAIKGVQKQLGVAETGFVDLRVLGALDKLGLSRAPNSMQRWAQSGQPMSSLAADASVPLNQIPRWVWGVGGGLMLWMAYRAWRK